MRFRPRLILAAFTLCGLVCLPFVIDRIATNIDARHALAEKGRITRLVADGEYGQAERLLRRIDRTDLSTRQRVILAYQDAICSRMLRRPAQAYERLERLRGLLPALWDYREFWMAHSLEAMGETEAAIDAYEDLAVTSRQGALTDSAYMQLLSLHTQAKHFKQALNVCERLLQVRPGRAPELEFRMAEIHTKIGNQAKARQLLAQVVRNHPAHPRSLDAIRLLPEPVSAVDLQATGSAYQKHGRFAQAARMLLRFLREFPAHEDAGQVTYALGNAYRAERKYRQAQTSFRTSYEKFGIAKGLYRLGGILVRLDQEMQAIESYRTLVLRFPDHELADDALWQAAKAAGRGSRFTLAEELYAQLANDYETSEFREEAHWNVGFTHYCRGQYDRALALFREVSDRALQPHIVDQALYWSGKSAARLGNVEAADDYYRMAASGFPRSYYSSRALVLGYGQPHAPVFSGLPEQRTRTPDSSADSARQPAAASVSNARAASQTTAATTETHLSRARVLGKLGLFELAKGELRWAERHCRGDLAALRSIRDRYVDLGSRDQALRLSFVIFSRDADRREFPHLYPSFYWKQIERAAREARIDPYLVLSVIRQESSFREDAVSRAGAIGLMQIMPKTGRLLARKVGLRRFQSSSLFDPHISIRLGSRFLSDQVHHFSSGPTRDLGFELGLAAYNAGPRAATAWTERFSYEDPDTFVERIPYKETRKYVKLVLKNYAIYKALSEVKSV